MWWCFGGSTFCAVCLLARVKCASGFHFSFSIIAGKVKFILWIFESIDTNTVCVGGEMKICTYIVESERRICDISIFLFASSNGSTTYREARGEQKERYLQSQAMPSFSRLSPASCINIYRYDVRDTHLERINSLVSFSPPIITSTNSTVPSPLPRDDVPIATTALHPSRLPDDAHKSKKMKHPKNNDTQKKARQKQTRLARMRPSTKLL
ncbi:hypothetical protein COCC4DRAFT_67778 [Bipolaris maydis ATCC 48331]|uniref:Secreted protein n=2 Tax=Cochliobolus heterostrophus TaxID=5016 RepID=M2V7K7_COCH5|nr:uncharacterized protein COCC4DRAFT_67778 [Bipolaris maydis ATCC 48331]EMD95992.1 hypothetical protein COCHEDRAFT_1200909 [Bipolaris maydis C5]ENI10850.1 hypothetical protein COCC4DRAFT_67778 [Bipolaris maydis ATCC 48331]KAJ6213227.1 hypothetical protein PSV09DRAFT_1200909 [Bipolaris maydis]